MKQIYLKTFLLALFTIFGMRASAYDEYVVAYVDGIHYYMNKIDKTAKVIFNSNGYSGNITIPESIAYKDLDSYKYNDWITYSVTSIYDEAFKNCSGLTSIKIPNSMTSIGNSAFSGCSGLTSVEIPNSVTSIGNSAFSGCSSLTSIVIPNSVTSIGDRTFSGCSNLTSVVIPNSVTSIGGSAFLGCSGLTSIVIPNSVTHIYNYTFCDCTGLTSVVIPNSVTSIGEGAFRGCSSLIRVDITDIAAWCNIDFYDSSSNPLSYAKHLYLNGEEVGDLIIPNGVTSICDDAFYNCSGLTSVEIPNSVTSIGGYAFYDCRRLTSVVIPNSVTSIGKGAFSGCSSLTSVVIPNSVTSIGSYTFSGCSSLTSIEIPNSVTSIGGCTFSGCSNLTSVVIPNSVTSIAYSAFQGCSSLTRVNITDIAAWCNIDFENPDSNPLHYAHHLYLNGEEVEDLVIPNSVTTIGSYTFYGCEGLTSVVIPNSVTSIGDWAFDGCSGLTSVVIPNSVTSIGYGAFQGCSGLTRVNIKDIIAWCEIKFDGGTSNPLTYAHHLYLNGNEVKDLVIPNSVTTIGSYTFYGCSGLTSVVIPNSVTSIGWDAFQDCSGLTSVEIPNSVTTIGDDAFSGCSSLTRVNIKDIIAWCKIKFDNSTSNPLTYAHHLYLNGNEVKDLVIPNSVTTIGSYTFYGCSGLTSVVFPNSVTFIGYSAFSGCSSLSFVEFPNSVKNIDRSFADCSSLSTIVIPNSLVYADFEGCYGLTTIISYISEPSLSFCGFSWDTYNNATLYVPAQSIELYRNARGWILFKNILPIGSGKSFTMSVTDDQSHDVTNDITIVWYDGAGKELGTGNTLNGVDDGADIYYSVLLGEGLGRVYREVKMKKVDNNINTINCKLEKIGRVILEGRVTAADIDKTSATVNVKQMLNGKYEQTYQTQTNEQGIFQVEVYDDETDITISGNRYLNATIHRDNFSGNGDVGTIPLNLVTGFSVVANINLQKTVETGDTGDVTAWDDGLSNIEFSLTNMTKNKKITDFTVQNGNVIIKSGADMGDGIRLAAKSKQGVFADAETTFNIKEGTNVFDLLLTERGGLEAVCNLSNNGGTNGYLYDSNGVLASMGSYMGEILSLRHLPKGTYTLVSIGRSMLLGSMTNLSDLASVGLTEDEDYVATRVEVSDGVITNVQVNEVPRFQETKIYYTTTNTYFNVEKPSITAGNYLTLSAHLDFKPEYADKVNGVSLSIDLPDGCQLVENSAIANRQPVTHTKNGNRMTFTLTPEQYQSTLRFCIIPVLNKNYTITAIASFDGERKVQQPIGTAQFEAKGLSLSVPPITASSNVIISGTAKGHSEVSIYDNDVLIGKTSSKADGTWSAQVELFKPRSHSFHEIYAKIIAENGMELTSETKQVEYNIDYLVPEKVTMTYYNGWYGKNMYIEFNLLEGSAKPSSYEFYQIENFTFLADFTRNDTTRIKNVNIKVLNTDGTVRTLPAIYDSKQNHWVATTKYTSANRLPQNVTVEYDLFTTFSDEDRDEYLMEEANKLVSSAYLVKDYFDKNVEFTLIEDSENHVLFECRTNEGQSPLFYRIEGMDYFAMEELMRTNQFTYIESEEESVGIYWEMTDNGMVVYAVDIANAVAFKMSLYNPFIATRAKAKDFRPAVESLKQSVSTGQFLDGFLEHFGNLIDLLTGIKEYWNVKGDFENLCNTIIQYQDNLLKVNQKTFELVLAKCPDGSYKLSEEKREQYSKAIQATSDVETIFAEQYYNYLQEYKNKLKASVGTFIGTLGLGKALGALGKSSKFVSSKLNRKLYNFLNNKFSSYVFRTTSASILSSTIGTIIGSSVDWGIDQIDKIFDYKDFNGVKDKVLSWSSKEYSGLLQNYIDLQNGIKKDYKKCVKKTNNPDEDEDEPTDDKSDFRGQGSTPIHDPSGYVYEAVTSNRLQGVTATVYQKTQKEDMYGDITEEAVAWNAEDYSQKNPLITDQDGFYRWDVPQGMWQVKYEKEGYETMYSDWLPVPPPQLDVNIGMYQGVAPQVEKMRGFESGIVIDMSKYMKPETYGKNSITVTRNGQKVNGTIIMLNAEENEYEGREYASKMKFIPEMEFNVTDNVVVTVHKEVESYCGIKMENDHTETVKIEPEIKEIVSDSVITVTYQGAKVMDVLVLPKDASVGKILHVDSSSPIIASLSENEVEIDSDGRATFTLNGELPGGANLSFTVDGSDVSASTKVYVTLENDMVAMPQASIRSGETVNSGTLLVLTCETEYAIIYYTLDGSCPCDETKRIKYEGPITINGDVTVKAIAVKEDMNDSDIATFMYILNGIQGPGYDKTNVNIEYQNGAFVITGAEGATCNIFDLAGQLVASKQRIARRERMVFSKKGVYVVNVETTDGVTVAKKMVVK